MFEKYGSHTHASRKTLKLPPFPFERVFASDTADSAVMHHYWALEYTASEFAYDDVGYWVRGGKGWEGEIVIALLHTSRNSHTFT